MVHAGAPNCAHAPSASRIVCRLFADSKWARPTSTVFPFALLLVGVHDEREEPTLAVLLLRLLLVFLDHPHVDLPVWYGSAIRSTCRRRRGR